MLEHITFDHKSRKPKYLQIFQSIIENISLGNLKMDQRLPSINNLSEELYVSRDTVEKAYSMLKKQKVIVSIKGKGYFINRTPLISKINILLLINKLSNYKMRIYNSFRAQAGAEAHINLQVYHCDEELFINLLNKYYGGYDYYVIMPHFKTESLSHISITEKIKSKLVEIPQNKLVILDNNKDAVKNCFLEVYQDFEEDIYNALTEGLEKILHYNKLVLVCPEKTMYPYPKSILHGFRKFCAHNHLDFEVYEEIYEEMILKKGDLFIVIEETDLVHLLKRIKEKGFLMGAEIGVISYNDTPLKELLGITVISTDFAKMGEVAAQMIMSNTGGSVKNDFNLINRQSV
ncbi:GntR family transcriptional regulator [Flagellimonas sp. CMM7]|uniref:GntR family transcriptional regulator n=1 Tax=Flagellimonas sp. CMM7 TaxID=2654676 RepID=UPI0013CF9A2C|nr:GntR family transcriptional regulator [Flagellimonas sp. CMM7]UII78724.1 GntR family transcriptional regulator [Flagellimonas sp. CMM7]